MKKQILLTIFVAFLIIMLFTLTGCNRQSNSKDEAKLNIVTSFYPINIMVLNIIDGATSDVTLDNMTDSQVGCLHEYTLKTQDLIKLENADVLIENGLGIESFNDKVTEIYPDLKIIDSSNGINLDTDYKNPHIWTSTENYIKQVDYITKELVNLDSKNAELYEKNAKAYIDKILQIRDRFNNNTKIKALTFNEEFEYLAEENNIDLITIETQHEESALSAENLASVIDQMKKENIKVILVNSNENTKNAQLVADETGAQLYELDPYITGEFDKNSFLNALTKNLEIINKIKQ